MKTTLKKYLIIESIFIVLVFLFNLINTNSTYCYSGRGADSLTSATWMLKTLNGNDVVKEKAGKEIPYLTLNTKENTVFGSTGCNTINGTIIVSGDEIRFKDMSMTKMFCDDANYEQDFVSYLFKDTGLNFKVENGILIFYEQNKAVMSFERK